MHHSIAQKVNTEIRVFMPVLKLFPEGKIKETICKEFIIYLKEEIQKWLRNY